MKLDSTPRWLLRLLVLFPATGTVTGTAFDYSVFKDSFISGFGTVFGFIFGMVFGAMIAWPTINIRFWKVALFTAAGTVAFGTLPLWAWRGAPFDILLFAPAGFWAGYLLLYLQVRYSRDSKLLRAP